MSGPVAQYDADFFPGATHDPAVPNPDSVLGFRLGDKPILPAEVERVLTSLVEGGQGEGRGRAVPSAARCKLVEYARTHEGRPCYYMIITSAEHMARLDALQADLGKLADPRALPEGDGDRLADSLPAVAWMAYTIHGDEMSGTDAATALAWHLASATDAATLDLLKNLIVIIDPLMNPDGRERCIRQIREVKGRAVDLDSQSAVHEQFWPAGRTNHYLFDMNRDWIFGTQPETRGRHAALNQWHPVLFVDSHEMGALETHLFSPSRAPINPHLPSMRTVWWDRFALDQAAAFDARGWRYYTGEWNEEWYPGYSSSFAGYRGAVGILYEQANIATDGIRRPEGTIEPYRQAVHKQLTGSLANLRTAAANRAALNREFLAERRASSSGSTQSNAAWKDRVLAVRATANRSRDRLLIDNLRRLGIEVRRAQTAFKGTGKDHLGRAMADVDFAAGTYLIEAAQPESPLLRAVLDFDIQMTPEFLADERRELLRTGSSKLYDLTGWSLTMLSDSEAYWLDSGAPRAEPMVTDDAADNVSGIDRADAGTAYIIDGADDLSTAAAAHLMEAGLRCRIADRALLLDGKTFSRGSVVINRVDNPSHDAASLGAAIAAVTTPLALHAVAIHSGLGIGNEVPDLGGGHFPLLERPRIAIASRDGVVAYDFGSIWFTLDQRFGLRSSHIALENLSGVDARRYNVIIVPDGSRSAAAKVIADLKPWVESGGTLIAIGSSAAAAASKDAGISSVRTVDDVIADKDSVHESLDKFELQVIREWQAAIESPVQADIFASLASAAKPNYPWASSIGALERPAPDELTRRDAWQSLFSPQGTILAARTDDKHFLTFGCGPYLPVLIGSDAPLMAALPAECPIRFGYMSDAAVPPTAPVASTTDGRAAAAADEAPAEPAASRFGFALLPTGKDMHLRMSGLLWPEAAERIANTAWVTRERIGQGQVILFASPPTFRASTHGMTRVLMNAVVYGPGVGASHPILP